jgi:DNA-binding NtrC family response regulator
MSNTLGKILIIDDDATIVQLMKLILQRDRHEVFSLPDGDEALAFLESNEIHAIFLDVFLPQSSGIGVLKRLREHAPDIPVTMITASLSVENAIAAMKLGAFDYLIKPEGITDPNRLLLTTRNALSFFKTQQELHRLRTERKQQNDFDNMIGESEAMRQVFAQMRKVVASQITVLITGESGTGKEMVARALHDKHPSRSGRFVDVNCAAIPENLLESDLFGHEKGAFTGALCRKIGKFELANGGTIFLDEIGDMPMYTQAKILRVLQERSFERVGGAEKIGVDVRVIAATNRNLEDEVRAGRFREDLFYRLSVFPIHLPALRERSEDVLPLSLAFLHKFANQTGKPLREISPEALGCLRAYPWRGNVRELQNVIERAVVLAPRHETVLRPENLSGELRKSWRMSHVTGETFCKDPSVATSLVRPLWQVERDTIAEALAVTGGNAAAAAKCLEIGRATMYRKIKEYQLAKKTPATANTDEPTPKEKSLIG